MPESLMNDIVEIRNVSKSYPGGITAVDNVSLSVREGEFVTLLGPSGCGKTTTLRMIAGFELPSSGEIFLAGEDVTDLPPYERRVNTVFQDYALFPHMNVRDNVGYGLRVAGLSKPDIRTAVDDALAKVGLQDKSQDRPANLSGGQKQRVALARALVRKPKVLLLDEPLSALDAKLREAMQVELKHLHEQSGITFVFVTHDQKEALVMSDRIVVMSEGRIVQSGTPAELYETPASPYVADFIGSSNKLYSSVLGADDDNITFKVDQYTLSAATGQHRFKRGDDIVVTVRPEKIKILNGSTTVGNDNVLSGSIQEVLFHGGSCRVKVKVGDRQIIDVDAQLDTSLDAWQGDPGQTVQLVMPSSMLSVFPRDQDNV